MYSKQEECVQHEDFKYFMACLIALNGKELKIK